jgi:hypothetical protein
MMTPIYFYALFLVCVAFLVAFMFMGIYLGMYYATRLFEMLKGG